QAWAIETRSVHAVVPVVALTPLPDASAGVAGVLAWRGEPLIVRTLDDADPSAARAPFAVVVGGDAPEFALLADAVPELAPLRLDDVRAAPAKIMDARPWLMGVTDRAELLIQGDQLIAYTKREDEQ
ncbi:MAG TPA: chemotaxis protein CheW, partial [Longimicrobiales bacterium]